jgi:ornithine cyclodeaminase
VTVFPGNAARGLPLVTGVVVVNDASTGLPLAVIDGAPVTTLRTAAASAVATRALAGPRPRILAVIGAGAQGRAHLRLLAQLYEFDEVRVSARRLDSARSLVDQFAPRLSARLCAVATPEEAASGADVVVTATTSHDPVLEGAWLEPGAHVCAVGSATPSHREIDADVLERASVIAVDSRDGALAEAGDFLIPIAEGRLAPERVVELGQILNGDRLLPTRGEHVTVYKGVGTATLDAAVADAIYRRAVDLGIGVQVPFTAE